MPRPPKYTPVAATALAASPPNLFTGTSGWAYNTWKPGFYPPEVPSRAFLHHYAARFTSVEVNYTFRTLCEEEQLNGWLAATPPGFRFSFKAPQQITHFKRLLACDKVVEEFIASLEPARAAGKLGLLLFQLPPNFKADTKRFTKFLAMPALADASLQLAFEFRNETWFAEPIYDMLRRHNAALCVAENEDLVTPDIATANFCSYRLRRPGGYSRPNLKRFAERFTAQATTLPVYAYFKHEEAPTGALNALSFLRCANKLTQPLKQDRA